MRNFSLLLLSLSALLLSGCGMVRGLEQWKCDNLGMCHFGVTPSAAPCQPQPLGAIPTPSFEGGYVDGGYVDGGQHCENCR